jgi:hypothetical protein
LLAVVASLGLLLQSHLSGTPTLLWALVLAVLGTVGLCWRRVWGVFLWLASAAALLCAAAPEAFPRLAIIAVAGGLFALHLPPLLRTDRLATALAAVVALGIGAGGGIAARVALEEPARPWASYVAPLPAAEYRPPPVEQVDQIRRVDIAIRQLPQTNKIAVTFTNRSQRPLRFALLDPHYYYVPIMEPALDVATEDDKGRRLKRGGPSGCLGVFGGAKYAAFAPGARRTHTIAIAYARYPSDAVVPARDVIALLTNDGLLAKRAKRKVVPRPPPLRTFFVRVRYHAIVKEGTKRVLVQGESKRLRYVSPY